jgi:hypothetical protein
LGIEHNYGRSRLRRVGEPLFLFFSFFAARIQLFHFSFPELRTSTRDKRGFFVSNAESQCAFWDAEVCSRMPVGLPLFFWADALFRTALLLPFLDTNSFSCSAVLFLPSATVCCRCLGLLEVEQYGISNILISCRSFFFGSHMIAASAMTAAMLLMCVSLAICAMFLLVGCGEMCT